MKNMLRLKRCPPSHIELQTWPNRTVHIYTTLLSAIRTHITSSSLCCMTSVNRIKIEVFAKKLN